ncbi:uroporphyrinogen-III C-methyltransferase [Neisseriaceae bacterium ESL0693]|nr:uroporphyrinogen-III C-methyltransferase [Neisseriaceae bacterium ESL0693]
MSEQHNTDNKQSSVQPDEPILVNAQGQAKVTDEHESSSDVKHHIAAQADKDKQNNKKDIRPASKTEISPTPAPVNTRSGGGKGLAAGALILSILALGASGFLFVEGQNQLKLQQLKYDQKMDAAGIGASHTAVTLQTSLVHIDQLTQQLKTLEEQQTNQHHQLAKLDNAYQQLIRSRTDWLVDEVEATLNMAAQQLIISGNVPVAVSVLEDLDGRLARFDQPQLLPIKKAISTDLEDLKSKPYLDVASASLRLNRLETAVTSLPLLIDDQLQPAGKSAATEEGGQLPWWQRAWYSTVHALQGMVEVRHIEYNDAMLMSPQQIFFVRENLRLKLADARLALMQRSNEVYSADLNSIEATVNQYFDGHSATTQSWLNELAQLKSLNIQSSQDANILTHSLTAVRQYQKQNGMDTSLTVPDMNATDASSAASEPQKEAESASEPAKPAKSAPQVSIQAMRSIATAKYNRRA